MTVTVRWFNESNTIIYYEFQGKWTWDEFEAVFRENLAMLDTVDHEVGFIVNMLASAGLPSGALGQVKRIADVRHPNTGLTVYVGMTPLLRALGEIFRKVYPRSAQAYPFDFASSVEEALRKLDLWNLGKK